MFNRILTIVVTFFIGISQLLSQDVEEIVAKVMETRGDYSVYKNLNSLLVSGTQSQMGMNIPFKMCYKKINDKKAKYFLESEAMGSKQQMGTNGDTLWADIQGLQIIPKEYEEQFISQISQIKGFAETPLLKYKEKGHKLELSGIVNEDGRDAYTLKLIQDEGREIFLYVDKNNYELFKLWFNMPGENDQEVEVEMNYSDYKKINGFSIPHKMSLKTGDFGTMDIILEKVEFNPVLDDAMFNVPKEEAKTE